MQRIAILSDIHGNMPALEAVLADISKRGIKRIICLGDLAGKGPNPIEAVDRIRDCCEIVIRGNWDELIGRRLTDKLPFTWHEDRLGAERLQYLANLPFSYDMEMSGKRIRLVHASPQSVYHRVQPWDSEERRLGMFDNTPETGKSEEDPKPEVVGYGDIHNVYVQHMERRMLFNVGSVGNALDMVQASYAILEGVEGGSALDPFSIQLVRVPYDIELAVQHALEADVPEVEMYIRELRTGVYRGLQHIENNS